MKSEERKAKAKAKADAEGGAKKPKLPIWKTAKHSSEVQAKITLPHMVDGFTARSMLGNALPPLVGIVSLEVKYVVLPDSGDARKLADECWEELMESARKALKEGEAK